MKNLLINQQIVSINRQHIFLIEKNTNKEKHRDISITYVIVQYINISRNVKMKVDEEKENCLYAVFIKVKEILKLGK